jgi:hypothetical protein
MSIVFGCFYQGMPNSPFRRRQLRRSRRLRASLRLALLPLLQMLLLLPLLLPFLVPLFGQLPPLVSLLLKVLLLRVLARNARSVFNAAKNLSRHLSLGRTCCSSKFESYLIMYGLCSLRLGLTWLDTEHRGDDRLQPSHFSISKWT